MLKTQNNNREADTFCKTYSIRYEILSNAIIVLCMLSVMAILSFLVTYANEMRWKIIFTLCILILLPFLLFGLYWKYRIHITDDSIKLKYPLTKRVAEIPWEKITKIHWDDCMGRHFALNIVCDPSVRWKFPFEGWRNVLSAPCRLKNLDDFIMEVTTRAKDAEIDPAVLTCLQEEDKKMTW